MAQPKSNVLTLFICLALALSVFAVFSPALKCDFTNYDDPDYVTENEHLQSGITAQSLNWAFTAGHSSNWHPLTWISHMLDVQLYGLNPVGHHLTNILFHASNAVLLFLLLRRMTGSLWPSAFVAAMFGLHPLRVESVAWVAERKDVLSTFFWMLTAIAYVRYVQTPARRRTWFALSLLSFALALMSKPMVVTLPFVLLLIDVWPLKRINISKVKFTNLKPVLLEKLPFIALAFCSSIITLLVQQGAKSTLEALTLSDRVENMFVAYARYLAKTFWPTKLAVFYPLPAHWAWWEIIASIVVLTAITVFVVRQLRVRPYLAVGWFWFLGMLIPVIGLVQVGSQSMADRYSYLATVGVFIAITWASLEFIRNSATRIGAAVMALALCCLVTPVQAGYWKNGETLFTHALAVTRDNHIAYNYVGYYLWNKGETDQAIEYYRKSIEIEPTYDEAHNNYGIALAVKGQLDDAIEQFQIALRYKDHAASAHGNLGNAYAAQANNFLVQGNNAAAEAKFDDAISEFNQCLRLKADDSQGHYNLGNVYAQRGKSAEAIQEFRKAIQLKPENPEAHFALGFVLSRQGKSAEAETEYLIALKQKPNYPEATQQLSALRSPK